MADWYAATDGLSTNAGSLASPWDLATALADTASIGGGDTLYLRAGTYTNANRNPATTVGRYGYELKLVGAAGNPITVRPYRSERVIVDPGFQSFTYNPQYVVVRDLEIRVIENVGDARVTVAAGSDAYVNELNRPSGGVNLISGVNLKIINCVIHDCAQGMGFWGDCIGESEAYGNIIYNNGWDGPDRNHGHGIYTQNGTAVNPATSWKHITNNFLLNNWSQTFQAYGSTAARVDWYQINQNIGWRGPASDSGTFWIAGDYPSDKLRVSHNLVFDANMQIGASAANNDAIVSHNRCKGDIAYGTWTRRIAFDNFEWQIAGSPTLDGVAANVDNPYVFIYPNRYDPYRSHLTIMNWPQTANVTVDFASVLNVGDTFRLINPTDFWGTPAYSATWQGTPLSIPVASAEFATYVVMRDPPTGGTAGWQ